MCLKKTDENINTHGNVDILNPKTSHCGEPLPQQFAFYNKVLELKS